MQCQIVGLMLVIVTVGVSRQAGEPAKQPKSILAGWPGVFPTMKGYQLTFQAAEIKGDKKAADYRQTADYEWTGGADRHFTLTVARNADVKTTYSDDAMKQRAAKAKKIEVGKHVAWLMEFEKKNEKKSTRPPHARLIVLLGDDRVLLIDQSGLGPFAETVQAVAEKLDLQRIKQALDNPPDTGSHRTVDAFRQLKKGMSYADAATWVGTAEKDIGSGIHIMVYTLDDGSRVLLGFADLNKLMYAKHQGQDGKTVDLVD